MNIHSNEAVQLCLTNDFSQSASNDSQNAQLVYHEPLDEDRQNDPVIEITHRQLLRLIFMAAETGVRFRRDNLSHDPVNWLLTPTKLFDGEAPVDACKRHDAFLHGIIVHGLSLGLDTDPNDIAELLASDEEEVGLVAMQSAPAETMRSAELSSA